MSLTNLEIYSIFFPMCVRWIWTTFLVSENTLLVFGLNKNSHCVCIFSSFHILYLTFLTIYFSLINFVLFQDLMAIIIIYLFIFHFFKHFFLDSSNTSTPKRKTKPKKNIPTIPAYRSGDITITGVALPRWWSENNSQILLFYSNFIKLNLLNFYQCKNHYNIFFMHLWH